MDRRHLLALLLCACSPAAPVTDASPDASVAEAGPEAAQDASPEPPPDAALDAPAMDAPGCDGAVCAGACVDLASDRFNCGRCGHQCAGAAGCTEGACVGPEPLPDVRDVADASRCPAAEAGQAPLVFCPSPTLPDCRPVGDMQCGAACDVCTLNFGIGPPTSCQPRRATDRTDPANWWCVLDCTGVRDGSGNAMFDCDGDRANGCENRGRCDSCSDGPSGSRYQDCNNDGTDGCEWDTFTRGACP